MLLFLYPLETLGKNEFPDVFGGWKEKIDLKRLTVILIKWIFQKTRSGISFFEVSVAHKYLTLDSLPLKSELQFV